jgi:choline dehydrogenase-like flavoprotein
MLHFECWIFGDMVIVFERGDQMPAKSTDGVIVGAGARGGLITKELTGREFSVVTLEACKRFDPYADLANSEANTAKIVWTAPRGLAGKHDMVPKAGVGVGGGTLAWLGVAPDFTPPISVHIRVRAWGRIGLFLR